jgi:nitroreductase
MTASANRMPELASSRRCTRAFRPEPVPLPLIEELLETAALAPSTFNTQPWRVHVIVGERLRSLSDAILSANAQGSEPVFSPFPGECPAACSEQQADFGRRYYEALGIDREDMAARQRQTARNYAFFGAPAGLMLTIDRRLKPHSWLDLGLFLQTFMLAASERGVATCPQVAFARYERVIARALGFAPHDALACGMSIGYADAQAPVNRLRMPRLHSSEFATWHVEPAAAVDSESALPEVQPAKQVGVLARL